MIILITGASLTGKTLLAQRMQEEYKMPYVSIDHLKMGLIRSGMTELTPEDDEAKILLGEEEVIIHKDEAFLVEGRIPHSCWNNIEGVTKMIGITVI